MAKVDENLTEVVNLLPVDGHPIPYEDWRKAILDKGWFERLPYIQNARRQGLAIFGFDANGVHIVSRQIKPGG